MELQLQDLQDQTEYVPNLRTRSSSSTSATVTTPTSIELASSHARITSLKFTKQESVSQSVSELVTGVDNDQTQVY